MSGPEASVAAGTSAIQNAWRSAEFVSDLHLCEEAPRTFEAFAAWLQSTRADALFVLGDLFEVWIGDDTRTRPFAQHCLAHIAAAAAQRPVFFIHGNRDFLLGAQALGAAGMQALTDPFRLHCCGQDLLLSHGDSLCLSDAPYQTFRRMVRSPEWQREFLAKPVAEREAIAQRIRNESQGRKAVQPDVAAWPDVDNDEAQRWLQLAQATTLVHGHTHRPALHLISGGFERRVLPDWDFDGTVPRGYAVRLDSAGWSQVSPSGAVTPEVR